MVSPNLPELSLDLSPPVVLGCFPDPDFLTRIVITGDYDSNELFKLNDFINGLEDELKKIQAFKRELPLSCLLLNDAIMKLKEKVKTQKERRKEGKFDASLRANLEIDHFDKKNWMSSAQLWSPRSEVEEDDQSRESQPCRSSGEVGAFSSKPEDSGFALREEPRLSLLTPVLKPPTVVEPGPGSGNRGTGAIFSGPVSYRPVDQTAKPQIKPAFSPTAKKQRRCWSPELHRRFVDALEKLGGSQVATPKQIRELMQVDGLTNDEVKSHLQKYRLHVRKLPSSKANPSSSNEMLMDQDQLELSCSKLDLQPSGSPEGPLHLARSGKCNSTSIEEDEDKSDG